MKGLEGKAKLKRDLKDISNIFKEARKNCIVQDTQLGDKTFFLIQASDFCKSQDNGYLVGEKGIGIGMKLHGDGKILFLNLCHSYNGIHLKINH